MSKKGKKTIYESDSDDNELLEPVYIFKSNIKNDKNTASLKKPHREESSGRRKQKFDIKKIKKKHQQDGLYPYGCLVSINGTKVNPYLWRDSKKAPTYYGVVENPKEVNDIKAAFLDDDKSWVTFVASGHQEWTNGEVTNTVRDNFSLIDLTLEKLPPNERTSMNSEADEHFLKWFEPTKIGSKYKWSVKKLPNPCDRCGSPFCLHHNHKRILNKVLEELVSDDKLCNEQKRFIAYKRAIKEEHGRLGDGNRRRVGYCWENLVKSTFPSEEYTGFVPTGSDEVPPSSSADDVIVIDLSN